MTPISDHKRYFLESTFSGLRILPIPSYSTLLLPSFREHTYHASPRDCFTDSESMQRSQSHIHGEQLPWQAVSSVPSVLKHMVDVMNTCWDPWKPHLPHLSHMRLCFSNGVKDISLGWESKTGRIGGGRDGPRRLGKGLKKNLTLHNRNKFNRDPFKSLLKRKTRA